MSMQTQLTTAQLNYKLLRTANSTSGSITVPGPTTTRPPNVSGVDVIGLDYNGMRVQFFGTDGNNETFDALVGIYDEVLVSGVTSWNPRPLIRVTCTLSSSVAAAGGGVLSDDTTYFADTIVASSTLGAVTDQYLIESPADDASIAELWVDTFGAAYAYILFAKSTAASANALVKLI